ncbi:venom acid phosphatase Acph-1-like [Tenebrio molitor]
MNSVLIFFQFLAFFSAAISAGPAGPGKKDNTLVLLHVLFRHGNRTPDKASLFPNDLHLLETYDPIGYSQLTVRGKRTEYEIGKYLRKNYDNFIPDQYTPDVVYAISTNLKRTKMSLQLVLASLFPPLPTDVIDDTLNWQPVSFNIEPGQGLIGLPKSYCINYVNKYYSYVLSEEAQEIIAGYRDLYNQLTKDAGFDVNTPSDVGKIYATLKSEEDYGFKPPQWAAEIYPKTIEEAASVDYEFSTANADLKKLSAGFLLKKILQDSVSKQNGTLPEERKVFLYSAHEFNVAIMLRALNVFYRHVPPFGATIFFEIHNIKGQYGLKLFYQDYTAGRPRLLTIPGCASFCPLEDLYELVGENLPTDADVCSSTNEMM